MVGPSVMAPFGGQDEIGIDWVGGDFCGAVVSFFVVVWWVGGGVMYN